jgi:hypothetical protein
VTTTGQDRVEDDHDRTGLDRSTTAGHDRVTTTGQDRVEDDHDRTGRPRQDRTGRPRQDRTSRRDDLDLDFVAPVESETTQPGSMFI